ncbi:arsenic transporter [Acidovorax sp. SUPP950]|uniref:SLC13 family permease n=1 Tax=unclassified Acidovorax TaxID=2684926 RepID=UPI0023C8807E|nr:MULTISPECIES: SLC13 family permease [Comamonadaceae]WOI45275.1 SLC13 family permease [Paracidovorax avenae]GKS77213.1 arsenic transporter [Acidovorax sp. SUPP950]
MLAPQQWIWGVVAVATSAVILRPWRLPEAVWAVAGALALVGFGLLPASQAWRGVLRGEDVYLFLAGMMLLSEMARREGVFDWLAALAARRAGGSGSRLFTWVYLVGTLVTVFLSNDATAVVLTPAVFAVARAVGASPLPYLFICAFVANAASFVLPISNPANLVLWGGHMPPLPQWLALFALPSLASIAATFLALRFALRHRIDATIRTEVPPSPLSRGGALAAAGLAVSVVVLVACAWLRVPLGWPTLGAALVTLALLRIGCGSAVWPTVRSVSWSVLPLVAGLFVFVQALEYTGVVGLLADALRKAATAWPGGADVGVGALLGIAANLVNNLPAGLLAGAALDAANASPSMRAAALMGIDIGPNLSITGSLATLLWLAALRREGQSVSGWQFLRLGAWVMPLGLGAALLTLWITHVALR